MDCWVRALKQPTGRINTVLNPAANTSASGEQILALERRLADPLPRSYVHFLSVGKLVSNDSAVGLFHPSLVKRLKEFDFGAVGIAERHAIHASDEDYFRYGVDQDDVAMRSGNWREAIVVGKYGSAKFERIVLYPQVRTQDGEMESAIHLHSGEFRAPSFAELMRQLSHLEILNPSHVPPYAQEKLQGTCASILPMTNVWWK